ncbi:MAG: polysaccharide deacetylase family protein [Vicinamibacterales bacterium]
MPDSFFRPAGAATSISYEGETSTRVLKFVLALVFYAYDTARSLVRRLAGTEIAPPLVVLMYHSVKRDECERFARQIDQLTRLAHPVYADFQGQNSDHRRQVAVTFDDGYRSVLENALPILRERRVPATLFVPTQHLGKSPGWISDDRHRDAGERILTADELRHMRDAGALIGSHGVTHRPLTQLSDRDALAELADSRRQLAEILGQDVKLFALPYGAGSDDIVRLAASAGYTRLFLNVPVHRVSSADPVVGRIEVSPTDWPLEYRLKIRGAYQWLPWAMTTKRTVMNVLRRFTLKWLRRARPRMGVRAPNSAVN